MSYAVDILRLAREYEARIEEYPLESIDGLATRINTHTFIVLRSTAGVCAKRFVLAHELAHLEDGTVNSVYTLLAEKRADKIARERLIPEGKLREAIESYGADYQVLSSLFGVPEEAMKKRIIEVFNI